MAYQAQAVDATEPISDTSWEIVANQHLYGVISGCDATLDSGDMTYDIASGEILHNGLTVAVAAQTDAGTLVSDGSNPRFAWIGLDSAGVDVLVSGDASADPVVPELGDRVAVSLVRIPAAETLASNCTDIEKRVPTHPVNTKEVVTNYKSATQVFSADTTFADVVGADAATFAFAIAGSEVWAVDYFIPLAMTGTGGVKFQLTGPSAPTAVKVQGFRGNFANTDSGASDVAFGTNNFGGVTAFSTAFADANANTSLTSDIYFISGTNTLYVQIHALIINGSNAGTVTLQAAQNSANGSTTLSIGATMRAERIS